MNNRPGMMTSLLTIGAAGAAIYGIRKGVRNGTFQRLPQTVTNAMNNPQMQQMAKPLQNMLQNNQNQNNQNSQYNQNAQQMLETYTGTNTSPQQSDSQYS
ncbi:hypothetical protein ACFOGI_09460 [Virgibacillus xinjiangensis]|uniref:YtxH domain-containing protein n=1 Tax=Virgibacillus xinjiangensis TaxID=393090 RepID=A0ABV7CVU4_9BACI